MQASADSDNIYKVGTIARARLYPNRMLLIDSYKQRIYYCQVLGKPTHKLLVYFEAELIPPSI